MAFKEYSNYDFLYSGFTNITDTYCNNTNFDDLIDSSCKSYGTTAINVSPNGIEYQVTPNNDTINTIKEIADEFTKKSPYIFSYNGDKLVIESAKIRFKLIDSGGDKAYNNLAAKAYNNLAAKMTNLYSAYNSNVSQTIKDDTYAAATYATTTATDAAAAAKTATDAATTATAAATAAATTATAAATTATAAAKTATDAATTATAAATNAAKKHKTTADAVAAADTAKTAADTAKTAADTAKTAAVAASVAAEAFDKNAGNFLGYKDDGIDHKLPYMFTSSIIPTYDIDYKAQYKFGSFYMFGGDVDIRASAKDPYYEITNDILTDTMSVVPYKTPVRLIEHLNKKKIGFNDSTFTANTEKSYYKFEYDTINGKLNVVDLLYETGLQSITIDDISYNTTDGINIEPKNDNLTVSSGNIVFGKNVIKIGTKYVTLPYEFPIQYGTGNADTIGCIAAKQNKALCDNKSYADKLRALTTTHPGASERYDNIRGFMNVSILNIFNLGIGILATGVFIAKTYK